jgi:hypothetical protein
VVAFFSCFLDILKIMLLPSFLPSFPSCCTAFDERQGERDSDREGEREGERLLGSVCLIDKRGSE